MVRRSKTSEERYRTLIEGLSVEEIEAVINAQTIEEVKRAFNKPNISDSTAKAYQRLVRKYVQIAENPLTEQEQRIAQYNPQAFEAITDNVQRLRELEEENAQLRTRQAELEERLRTLEEQLRNQQQHEEDLESIYEQQRAQQPVADQGPTEPVADLDLDFEEAPAPIIEQYNKNGENITRIEQTPSTAFDLNYLKDLQGITEHEHVKIKMDIRLPEENRTIEVWRDLGKVGSITEAKELIEDEIEFESDRYQGFVIGVKIYMIH